jgi:hypothetical protein
MNVLHPCPSFRRCEPMLADMSRTSTVRRMRCLTRRNIGVVSGMSRGLLRPEVKSGCCLMTWKERKMNLKWAGQEMKNNFFTCIESTCLRVTHTHIRTHARTHTHTIMRRCIP